MIKQIYRKFKTFLQPTLSARRKYDDINPEDIFMDSANLPGFEAHRFEGKMEKPMGQKTFTVLKIVLALMIVGLVSKLWVLAVMDGSIYAQISENNRLEQSRIFANRGVIYDRDLRELATNDIREGESDFANRLYTSSGGLSHVVGYLKYPRADSSGIYYEENYRGYDGVERVFNDFLSGENGLQLKETDVFGNVVSESVVKKPVDGGALILSLDAGVTETLYQEIKKLADDRGFVGGAGVIMDVESGEILAMTSYPEYDQNVLTNGSDRSAINTLLNSEKKPFLNRVIGGLYTPGSVIKPIVALAALNERLISPSKEILSTGSISVPNPYDPEKPSIFKDWKAHGLTDMREAIAVSSDTYFYSIGGGFDGQQGLGISRLDKYLNLFGLTESTEIDLLGEVTGVIPTPEWKKENFDGDQWRLGDTYITSIGQYGTQITPLNAARFTAALANGGKILKTSVLLGGTNKPVERTLDFNREDLLVVQEGMREAVTYGTAVGVNVPYVKAAAKTGTAEVGSSKSYVHSWSVGFFPYDNPRYAWAVVMEKGPSANIFGATAVIRGLFDWMSINTPQYFE